LHESADPLYLSLRAPYAVSAAGQRLLVNAAIDESRTPPITMVTNWRGWRGWAAAKTHSIIVTVMLRAAVLLLSAANGLFAAAANFTIVLEFRGPRSERSIATMKREFEKIMKGSGLKFNWRLRGEAEGLDFDNLVVMRFNGSCTLEPPGYLYDERGPLAFTYTTDGAVQPFSEVACDHVSASVRAALHQGDFGRGDLLLGRALGRVVAHEFVHAVTRSVAHGHEGVSQAAISRAGLLADELPLSPADFERLRALTNNPADK
jgi:hypothetical protein